MKKLLLLALGVLIALPSLAQEFTFEGLNYEVLDADAKTVQVASNASNPEAAGDIVIPPTVTYSNEEYSVTEIGYGAFYGCSGLTEVTIPNSVTSIGGQAFRGCSELTSISIPNSVSSIGGSTFDSCSSLTSIVIPEGVKTLESWTFAHCTALSSVSLPASITTIGYRVFEDCPSITTLILPESLSSIGAIDCQNSKLLMDINSWGIFDDGISFEEFIETYESEGGIIAQLQAIKCYSPIPPENSDELFSEVIVKSYDPYNHITLYVPEESISAYQEASGWCKFANIKSIDENNDYSNNEHFTYEDINYVVISEEDKTVAVAPTKVSGELFIPETVTYNDSEYKVIVISDKAFQDCKELYAVSMPEGLVSIGVDAFAGCELLENFQFPSTLKRINDRAFSECKSLTEIILPEGLNALGNSVFSRCQKLEKAVLVADIYSLGNDLFSYCSALEKVYFPLQLRSIGDNTFCECIKIVEIKFPSTLESIGQSAFKCTYMDNYEGLSKLVIPNSVKRLGDSAFRGQRIKNLTIGSGLEVIPCGAFGGNSIRILNLSEGIKEISEGAFSGCYSVIDNGYIVGITSVTLPSTLTKIAPNAFSGTPITELVIPDKVTELPEGSCGKPSILTLGSGVKNLSSKAFSFENLHLLRVKAMNPPTLDDAFPLTNDLNDAITVVVNNGRRNNYVMNARWKQFDNIVEESDADIVVYMTGDYSLAEEIRTVSGYMPANVMKMKVVGPLTDTDLRVIKENMISLVCLDLSEVTNVTKLPDYQFEGSLLTEIKLPKGLTKIGNRAFADCSLLQLDALPDGVTEIGSEAFSNCPRVTISTLPYALKTIDSNAFHRCTGIRSITANENLESIGNGAFSYCSMLETVDLSASKLTEIGASVFSGCNQLDEVILPESATSIGGSAFAGTALRDIEFAANVTSIGGGSFSNCRRLVTANLPKKVTALSQYAFAECPRLISISMPSGMESVGQNILLDNKKLANISCAAIDAPAAETGAFDGLRFRYVSLTVPTTSFRAYLNAPQWGKFQTIQNKLIVSQDPGVDVSNISEEEYQDLLTEDALEEAAEAAANEQGDEPAQDVRRRAARRGAARAKTATGRQFAALFDGAQIQTGNESSATRIFVTPHEGVNILSILYNDEEMLDKMDGNSLLLPKGAKGSLKIVTDGTANPGDDVGINDIVIEQGIEVYDLRGVKVGDTTEGLPHGIYILRQGSATKKIAI